MTGLRTTLIWSERFGVHDMPVYAPFCWLALLETLAGAARSADPFAAFLAGAGFAELAPHQRELVDGLVAELRLS